MKPHNPNPLTIASAIQIYAKRSLPDIKSPIFNNSLTSKHKQKVILNSIVALLPAETQIQQASFPIKFQCSLLRLANFVQNNYDCKKKLEKLISAVLEHVTVDDLLVLCDVESVRRMVIRFMEREKNKVVMFRVTKTVDAYLHEIAKDAGLSILQFNGIASLVPKNVRKVDDDLYGVKRILRDLFSTLKYLCFYFYFYIFLKNILALYMFQDENPRNPLGLINISAQW
ncbi:putative NPH3 domain-containing protein [Helianthus debilis subsp. tardiflorus]